MVLFHTAVLLRIWPQRKYSLLSLFGPKSLKHKDYKKNIHKKLITFIID